MDYRFFFNFETVTRKIENCFNLSLVVVLRFTILKDWIESWIWELIHKLNTKLKRKEINTYNMECNRKVRIWVWIVHDFDSIKKQPGWYGIYLFSSVYLSHVAYYSTQKIANSKKMSFSTFNFDSFIKTLLPFRCKPYPSIETNEIKTEIITQMQSNKDEN